MLRIDLKAAGIPYRDEAGHYFDFHALRGQFITDLGGNGVGLQEAQKLARHSDPRLTANHYTHLSISDLSAAVSRLPGLTIAKTEAVTATGTDGGQNLVAGLVAGVGDSSCNSVRTIENGPASASKDGRSEKPLQMQGYEADCDRMSHDESERRRPDSNRRWRRMTPLPSRGE